MKRKNLRNIGIIAHVDAGKTTLTERILYYTGAIHQMGEVHNGATTTDFNAQERKRGITIYSAATTVYWHENQLNIIDTPGHIDFNIEVNRSLRILDGAVVVFDAVAGVEPQTETNWRLADQYHVPRICFINKMDRIGSDFDRVVDMMKQRLSSHPLVLQYPIGSESDFVGVVDLLSMQAIVWSNDDIDHQYQYQAIPDSLLEITQSYRQQLIEAVIEYDDIAMEQYLNGELPSIAILKCCIREATLQGKVNPVLCGTAFKNKGVQPLLDAIVDYLPTPAELENEAFSALVFKVVNDQHGSLAFARIYSGKLTSGDQVLNSTSGKKERISRIYEIQADRKLSQAQAISGDIVALSGLKQTTTGDTLCDVNQIVVLEKIQIPEPVIEIAIEGKGQTDQAQLHKALRSLVNEDPSLCLKTESESGQTILSGMGELQLQVNLSRLKDDFNLDVQVGSPSVAYRETIQQTARVRYLNKKQSGGPGQYAEVVLQLMPLDSGEGFIFENKIVAGHIPKEYIPSIENGICKAMKAGTISGYPVVDVKVILLDGSFHANDSSNVAFEWAAQKAFYQGMLDAKPILLEPMMQVEIITPSDYLGRCIGDINRRRGLMEKQIPQSNTFVLTANIPLAEMFGYIADLRALSSGHATFSMHFSHYATVPNVIAANIK